MEKRRPKGEKSPMVAARDHGCMVAGDPANSSRRISAERAFFRPISRFELFGPCDFSKIWFFEHNIRWSSSTSRIRRWNHEIIWSFKIANQPTKKEHVLPDRSWNQLDRCCRPIGANQCLNLHCHLTSNNMRIHRWSSQEEFQKTRRGPRLFKRLGDQLMLLIDPFMTN